MSALSEHLTYLIEKKGEKTRQLAERTGIDHSTMHQYVKGSRPLRNRKQLEAIMTELHLTPDERSKLLIDWEIAQVGPQTYNRRLRFDRLVRTLEPMAQEVALRLTKTEKPAPEEIEIQPLPPVVQGDLELNRVIGMILRDAVVRGQNILLITQPSNQMLLQSLLLVCSYAASSQITHLLCLDPQGDTDRFDNLDAVETAIRCTLGIPGYEAWRFYGDAAEHYGSMSLLPNLLLTDRYAMQISSDYKTALIHTNESVLAFLKAQVLKMQKQCAPLMTKLNALTASLDSWKDYYLTEEKYSKIDLYPGFLCTVFWTEEQIRTYTNRQLPMRETIVSTVAGFARAANHAYRQIKPRILMCKEYVEEFLKTGVMHDLPQMLLEKPVSKKDRRYLVQQVLQASEEGWLHVRLLPREQFPLANQFELCLRPNYEIIISLQNEHFFCRFQVTEPDLLAYCEDYLNYLYELPQVLDETAAAQLLKEWIELYLSEENNEEL